MRLRDFFLTLPCSLGMCTHQTRTANKALSSTPGKAGLCVQARSPGVSGLGRSAQNLMKPTIITEREKDGFDFGGLGVRWKIDGPSAQGRFAVVHHPIAPHALAAPLHYHNNEDEYSFVLKGTLGALLGDEVVSAQAGSWVFKPRAQWHTFWNPGDVPCEIIEVFSPAGFENYFREVSAAWGNIQKFGEINQRYQLEMDFESVPKLCERFHLTFPKL